MRASVLALVLAVLVPAIAAFTGTSPCFSRSAALAQTPPNSPSRHDTGELRKVQREVAMLRRVVEGLAGALVYCDDMALRERECVVDFRVHAELNLTAVPPALVRPTVTRVLCEHGLAPLPLR